LDSNFKFHILKPLLQLGYFKHNARWTTRNILKQFRNAISLLHSNLEISNSEFVGLIPLHLHCKLTLIFSKHARRGRWATGPPGGHLTPTFSCTRSTCGVWYPLFVSYSDFDPHFSLPSAASGFCMQDAQYMQVRFIQFASCASILYAAKVGQRRRGSLGYSLQPALRDHVGYTTKTRGKQTKAGLFCRPIY